MPTREETTVPPTDHHIVPPGELYAYDLRIEYVMKDGNEKVPANGIFANIISTIRTLTANWVVIMDTQGNVIPIDKQIDPTTFLHKFSVVSTQGKTPTLLFGFKLASAYTWPTIKN